MLLVADTIVEFLLTKRAENLSERTVAWYSHHLTVFSDWLGPANIGDVTSRQIIGYMASQRDPKRKPPLADYTLRARYATLRSFFNWAEGNREAGHPPSPIGHGANKAVKPPRTGKPATKFVPFRDYKRYVLSIQPPQPDEAMTWRPARDRLIGIILFWTGLRLQECINLQVGDIDTDRALLLVRQGKGSRARYVPFASKIVMPALLDYLYTRPMWDGPHLWLGETANTKIKEIQPLKPEGLRQILKRRCRDAKISYYNPHSWRHAFGEWLINSGVGIAAVSALMGHSSVKVTEEVYAHIRTPAVQREYTAAVSMLMSLDLAGEAPLW